MKKFTAVLVALLVALMPAFAENADTAVFEKMCRLMFEESNVTLTMQAQFDVDGDVFKVFRGEYKQDGVNSFMDVSLDTPYADSVSTGGFTVVANGDRVYSRDTYYGNYFVEGTCLEADTVLESTKATEAAVYLAQGVLDTLSAGGHAFFTQADGKYTVEIEGAPQLVNALVTYFAGDYIEENMYFGYGKEECLLYNDSVEKLIADEYKKVKGAEMPETFIEDAYLADMEDETWILYCELYDAVMERANTAASEYDGGILWLHENGEMTWHKDYADYMRASGNVLVDYEDYHASFRSYYENRFGEEYTDEMDMILAYTYNFDLWEAHVQLMSEMEDMYNKQAKETENAVYMLVHADGSVKISEKIPQTYEVGNETVTRRLLKKMRSLEIGETAVSLSIDEEGRIVKGEGRCEIKFIMDNGSENIVGITFLAEAKDYENTVVKAFAPEDYDSCMYDEYMESSALEPDIPAEDYSEEDYTEAIELLPETVTYAGVVYDTQIILP